MDLEKKLPSHIQDILNRVPLLIKEMKNKQVERDELIPLLVISLFSNKHIFLLGEPGVSKTGILETFYTCIDQGEVFDICMKDDTKFDEIFGESYRNEDGKLIYEFENTIINCHVAIIDEIWKGNSKILNSFLSILSNYRTVSIKGKGMIKTRILSAGAASNELATDPSLKALSDRFPIKYVVNRIQDDDNWRTFINREYDRTKELKVKFTVDEIQNFFLYTQNVTMSQKIVDILLHIKKTMIKFKIDSSDRKFDGLIDILNTIALLNGRMEIIIEDLFLLLHILWEKEEDIKHIRQIIFNTIFGTVGQVHKEYEYIKNEYSKIKNILDTELKDFLRFRQNFISDEAKFTQYVKYTQHITNSLKEILVNAQNLNSHYEYIKDLEDRIGNNLFIGNYKSNIYKELSNTHLNLRTDNILISIADIISLNDNLAKDINFLTNWVEENSSLYNYNLKQIKTS